MAVGARWMKSCDANSERRRNGAPASESFSRGGRVNNRRHMLKHVTRHRRKATAELWKRVCDYRPPKEDVEMHFWRCLCEMFLPFSCSKFLPVVEMIYFMALGRPALVTWSTLMAQTGYTIPAIAIFSPREDEELNAISICHDQREIG